MIKLLCTLLLICSVTSLRAQNIDRIETLISGSRVQTEVIHPKDSPTMTTLPSIFAEEIVESSADEYADLTIIKVYYIYTQYRQNANFRQKELDRNRFLALQKRFPEIIDDPYVEWQLIEQTGCTDYSQGNDFFHGFVFVHRPRDSKEVRATEIKRIAAFFDDPQDEFPEEKLDLIQDELEKGNSLESGNNLLPDVNARFKGGENALFQYLQKNLVNGEEVTLKRVDSWVETNFEIDSHGRIGRITFKEEYPDYLEDEVSRVLRSMPDWEPAIIGSDSVKSTVNLEIRISYSRSVSGMYKRDGKRPTFANDDDQVGLISAEREDELENIRLNSLKSTSIYLSMPLIDSSEKVAIVMDVTGSMIGNIAAMKRWLMNNPESLKVTSYSFFNDGDNKPTRLKKVGETGGIYQTKFAEEIKNVIDTAMINGSGGERSESDVEAMLYATKYDQDCDAIVLICDNYSEVRDLSLLSELNKKVYVLICAAPESVPPREDYLTIAGKMHGTLLLNGTKFELSHIGKGQDVFIGKFRYRYNGKTFVLKQ